MAEWSNARASKACILKGILGSNPSLSENLQNADDIIKEISPTVIRFPIFSPDVVE